MMPFGLQGASATFQRMMDCLIQGAHDFTAVYLDDLVIYSTSWEDHLYHLRTALLKLRKAGLTAKPSKCQYGMQQCVYLGSTVGGGILQPEVGKLQAIQQLPVPKTKRDVRAFLGITGYYRKQELILCRGEYLTLHSPVIYDCAEVKRLPFRVT